MVTLVSFPSEIEAQGLEHGASVTVQKEVLERHGRKVLASQNADRKCVSLTSLHFLLRIFTEHSHVKKTPKYCLNINFSFCFHTHSFESLHFHDDNFNRALPKRSLSRFCLVFLLELNFFLLQIHHFGLLRRGAVLDDGLVVFLFFLVLLHLNLLPLLVAGVAGLRHLALVPEQGQHEDDEDGDASQRHEEVVAGGRRLVLPPVPSVRSLAVLRGVFLQGRVFLFFLQITRRYEIKYIKGTRKGIESSIERARNLEKR